MSASPAKSDLERLKIPEESRVSRGGLWPWWGLVIVILLLGTGFWLWKGRPQAAPAVEVITVRLSTSAPAAVLSASGYVEPRRKATVAAKITGQIEVLNVEEGMAVEEGQILACLDDGEARARLAAAEASKKVAEAAAEEVRVTLHNAERTARRYHELAARQAIAQQDCDEAESAAANLRVQLQRAERQIEAAAASADQAREFLKDHTIRAPFAGIAISKDAQVGEMVSPISAGGGFTRTGISTIVDMSSLEVEVDVNENYIARVQVGQPVRAVLDAYPDWPVPSRVRTIIPSADRQKATVKVRISFNQLDPRILPEMGVKVFFLDDTPTGFPAPGPVLRVPVEALRRENAAVYVFADRNGVWERRAVTVRTETGGQAEVAAGLSEGDRIAARALPELREGMPIRQP